MEAHAYHLGPHDVGDLGRSLLAGSGDLHAHSVHSDGRLTIDQLASAARAQGLDYLAVTDHNTVRHHAHLAAASRSHGITLLPGQEITTPGGHAGALGAMGWVDSAWCRRVAGAGRAGG